MLWKFNQVYNPERQLADHRRPVRYELPVPHRLIGGRRQLYVHTKPTGRSQSSASPSKDTGTAT